MKLLFYISIIFFFLSGSANALSVIRDVEIETSLKTIIAPILKQSNLEPENIEIIILNDDEVNAFVSNGQKIYINTGLLSQSEEPYMVAGVMAHEAGHIIGGHLTQSQEKMQNALIKSTLGYMLGIAAAAAGAPEAGQAIALGTSHATQRNILKYTRTHEEEADHTALRLLNNAKISPKGLVDLLQILSNREKLYYDKVNPYTVTHPLNLSRIDNMKNSIATSSIKYKNYPDDVLRKYKRAIIKLNSFLEPSEKTLKKFPDEDLNINAYYARAIAYYKIPDIDKSLEQLNILLEHFPDNPYFVEIKGQILYENGRVNESIPQYKKVNQLIPNNELIKVQLATAQIATENNKIISDAIVNLEQALKINRDNIFAWRQLGIAYGRNNQLGESYLALAEAEYLRNDFSTTKKYINLAKKHIKKDTPAYIRYNDLQNLIKDK